MRRREFIKLIAGAATAWPVVARRTERSRFGVLNAPAGDPRQHVPAGYARGDHPLG
jgi:hypothetical protein